MYTLQQSAKKLGITRQALRTWLDQLNIATLQQGQGLYITEKDLDHIRAARVQNSRCSDSQKNWQSISAKIAMEKLRTFPPFTVHEGGKPA